MKKSEPHFCLLDGYTTNPGDLSWTELQQLGVSSIFDRTRPDQVVERCAEVQGILTNKVVLDRALLESLPQCQAVFLLSTGTNVVDGAYCRERGIPVCNIPAYSTASVAELVLAYLLDWARGVSSHATSVRQGDWATSDDFTYFRTPQRELSGRTLGLVGFGAIAQAVTRIAVAMGMRVMVTTPRTEGKPELGQVFCSLDDLWTQSDFLSLHCPLTSETEELVNAQTLSQMKPGSVLINTGRGGLVNECDLGEALSSHHLDAAYVDVLSAEPPPIGHSLASHPKAQITPHLAWATQASRQRLLSIVADNIRAWRNGTPQHVVNKV